MDPSFVDSNCHCINFTVVKIYQSCENDYRWIRQRSLIIGVCEKMWRIWKTSKSVLVPSSVDVFMASFPISWLTHTRMTNHRRWRNVVYLPSLLGLCIFTLTAERCYVIVGWFSRKSYLARQVLPTWDCATSVEVNQEIRQFHLSYRSGMPVLCIRRSLAAAAAGMRLNSTDAVLLDRGRRVLCRRSLLDACCGRREHRRPFYERSRREPRAQKVSCVQFAPRTPVDNLHKLKRV